MVTKMARPERTNAKLKLVWWAGMMAAIFWTLVYRFGADASDALTFVYVNF